MKNEQDLTFNQELLNEIESLKNEATGLIIHREYLINNKKSLLEAQYYNQIGIHRLGMLKLQAELIKLKREIDIVEGLEKQGQEVNIKEIEQQLDFELEAWKEKAEELKKNVSFSNIVLNNVDSIKDDVLELYKKLTKVLHPEFNKKQTEDERNLWIRIQVAFRYNDIDELKAIELFLQGSTINQKEDLLIEELEGERTEVLKLIEELKESIESISSTFPFDMDEVLSDPVEVAKIVRDIHKKSIAYQDEKEELLLHLSNLLKK